MIENVFRDRCLVSHSKPFKHLEFDVSFEEVVENGRIFKRQVNKAVDSSARFATYHVSDFTLENLQAAGAVEFLKPSFISATDSKVFASSLSQFNDLLDNFKES